MLSNYHDTRIAKNSFKLILIGHELSKILNNQEQEKNTVQRSQ
jgi:hypothetical protein